MQTPDAATLLRVWEAGAGQPPHERALLLLAATWPAVAEAELVAWSLGQRDAALLQLRTRLFGQQLDSVADCPQCQTRLELKPDLADLQTTYAQHTELACRFSVPSGDYQMQLSIPTTATLRKLAHAPGRAALLQQCASEVLCNGQPCAAAALPPDAVAEIARRLDEADAQANVQLALRCVACRHEFTLLFDVLTFLWTELDAWAQRLLREVHLLARAYGWSEAEILALSAARRRRYLDMVLA
jgi:hypothetical protein